MRTYLKIKVKSLAEEIRAIRLEKRKIKGKRWKVKPQDRPQDFGMANPKNLDAGEGVPGRRRPIPTLEQFTSGNLTPVELRRYNLFWGLDRHVHELSEEARWAQLAYGFLRETPYPAIEAKVKVPKHLNWDKVWKNVERFAVDVDSRVLAQKFASWKAEAEPASRP